MSTYKCTFCGRGYQRKIYYSRHVALCELMCKSIKERQLENQEFDDTPSVRVLYDVILEMSKKMSTMEQKMNEMSKWVDTKKRKINIINWLNENNKDMTLTVEDLIGRIKVKRSHLEYLFEEDYIGTIVLVLKELLPLKEDTNPIKAFEHKPNTLFVYMGGAPVNPTGGAPVSPHLNVNTVGMGGAPVNPHLNVNTIGMGADGGSPRGVGMGADGGSPRGVDGGSPRWIIIPDTLFEQLVNVVTKQLLDEFIIWQKENTKKMDQDDFAIKYANNAKKIMGSGIMREQIYGKVKLDLYKYLKRAIPLAVG